MVKSWSDILAFIRQYRRKDVFKSFSEEDIAYCIYTAIQNNAFAVVTENGRITAIAAAYPKHEEKRLHVMAILTTRANDLLYLINEFLRRYKGYNITAIRKGRFVRYNTKRLLRHLWATKDNLV